MKILKARYDLILLFFPIFLFISLLAYNAYFDVLIVLPYSNWLFDAFILLLFCLPISRSRLGTTKAIPSKPKWLVALFLVQLISTVLFWSLTLIIYHHHANATSPPPFNSVHFAWSTGFFPLGFLLLVAATLGFFTFIEQQSGTLASTYRTLFHNTDTDSIGIIVNTYMRLVVYFMILFFLGMSAIILMQLIFSLWGGQLLSGANFKVVLVCGLVISLCCNTFTTKTLHQLASNKIPIWLLFLVFALLLSVVYLILSNIVSWSLNNIPNVDKPYLIFDTRLINQYLQVVMSLLWFGVAIVAGAVTASLSRGYSIRAMFVVAILGCTVSWGGIYLLEYSLSNVSKPIVAMSLGLLSTIGITIWLLRNKVVTLIMRATLPTPGLKQRPTFYLVKTTPFMLASFVCTFMTLGISFLGLASVIIVLPCAIMCLISFWALLRYPKTSKGSNTTRCS